MTLLTAILVFAPLASAVAVFSLLTNNALRDEISELEQANDELMDERESASLPQPNGWTPDNCMALHKFLKSDTGHALIQRGRAMEFNRAIANARQGTEHASGITVGITETLNWIESLASDETFKALSQPSGAQDDHTTDGEQGDAALVERYSP